MGNRSAARRTRTTSYVLRPTSYVLHHVRKSSSCLSPPPPCPGTRSKQSCAAQPHVHLARRAVQFLRVRLPSLTDARRKCSCSYFLLPTSHFSLPVSRFPFSISVSISPATGNAARDGAGWFARSFTGPVSEGKGKDERNERTKKTKGSGALLHTAVPYRATATGWLVASPPERETGTVLESWGLRVRPARWVMNVASAPHRDSGKRDQGRGG